MGSEDLLNKIENIITERGTDSYLGEEVTMEQHMLQTALLAETEDGSDSAIAGALLHDIGHYSCLIYTSPSPRDRTRSRMPSSA